MVVWANFCVRGKNWPGFMRFYTSNFSLLILWSGFYAYSMYSIQTANNPLSDPTKTNLWASRMVLKSLIYVVAAVCEEQEAAMSHSASDQEGNKECVFSLYWPWVKEFNPSYKEPFHHINRFSCIWASLILGMWIYRKEFSQVSLDLCDCILVYMRGVCMWRMFAVAAPQ